MTEESDLLVVNRSDLVYTSCYCEENIWKLCEYIEKYSKRHLNDCRVVFVSNKNKMVPVWKQKAGSKDRDYLCIWDYHVFMIYAPEGDSRRISAQIYDFDSVLSFPQDFETYSRETLRSDDTIRPEYHRMFRVLEPDLYLKKFASNRMHMKTPEGSWLKPPPDYPCIRTNECDNNLDKFISMEEEEEEGLGFGTVVSLRQLNDWFSR